MKGNSPPTAGPRRLSLGLKNTVPSASAAQRQTLNPRHHKSHRITLLRPEEDQQSTRLLLRIRDETHARAESHRQTDRAAGRGSKPEGKQASLPISARPRLNANSRWGGNEASSSRRGHHRYLRFKTLPRLVMYYLRNQASRITPLRAIT